MNADKKNLRSSAFICGLMKNFTQYLHRVFRHDPQVVHSHPQPICPRLISIRHDGTYRDPALSRNADIRRWFHASAAQVNVFRRQRSGNLF
jgi:hypothetical protein